MYFTSQGTQQRLYQRHNAHSKLILISCYWVTKHEAHVEVSACIAPVILGFCARMICTGVYPFYISFIDCNVNIEI